MVWKGTSEDSGQSKQSEFTRPRLIFRFVTDLDIVKVTISFCSIKYWIAQYAQLNIWRRVEHESKQSVSLLGSKGTNEQRAKQAKRAYKAYEDLLMNCQNTVGMITDELILALSKWCRFHHIQICSKVKILWVKIFTIVSFTLVLHPHYFDTSELKMSK